MKHLYFLAFLFVSLTSCQNETKAQSTTSTGKNVAPSLEKPAIEKLLFAYRDALTASDVNKVLPLYTVDGVFMPSNAPTAVGQEQIKGAYAFVFSQIQLNIEFYIDEIVVFGDYAYARTTSKGTTFIHASGQTVAEENRELFVLQKANEQWKIDRYMFNKMK